MAEKKIAQKLGQEEFASGSSKLNLNEDKTQDKADAQLLRESISTLQASAKNKVDPDLADLGYVQVHHESAEDADDELDSEEDNEYEGVRPLKVKKIKTAGDQVHLSTNHAKQNTQITAYTHEVVKWVNTIAQAGKRSAELGLTPHIALKRNLPQATTPYPKLSSLKRGSKILRSSLPLRRCKGSRNLRQDLSDSASIHSIMSSYTYLAPDRRGRMAYASSNEHTVSDKADGNAVRMIQANANPKGSEDQAPKPNSKARTVLGYVDDDESHGETRMTDFLPSPKAAHEKRPSRKFFRRKGNKEPTTPSPSEKTSGRRVIPAPTLIGASPNAKSLLDSASLLINDPPSAKHVVNYSRPIKRHISSDTSSGSPVMLRSTTTSLHGSIPFTGPSTVPEGLTTTSLIHAHPDPSSIHEDKAIDTHHAVGETVCTEKNADASDGDSFNLSEYSGDECSIQQARAVPITFRGRAKLVGMPPIDYGPPSQQTALGGNPPTNADTITARGRFEGY